MATDKEEYVFKIVRNTPLKTLNMFELLYWIIALKKLMAVTVKELSLFLFFILFLQVYFEAHCFIPHYNSQPTNAIFC